MEKIKDICNTSLKVCKSAGLQMFDNIENEDYYIDNKEECVEEENLESNSSSNEEEKKMKIIIKLKIII